MKNQLFIIFFTLSSLNMKSQNIFKIIEAKRNYINATKFKTDPNGKYFRIVLNANSPINISYPFTFPKNIDTINAIAELLSYEGDTRLCSLPINNYNLARSQIYLGPNTNYSIQVEALFIINQLISYDPFSYASYPILVDEKTKKEYSIAGTAISKAFKAYKNWYQKLLKAHSKYIKGIDTMPLNNSMVKWY